MVEGGEVMESNIGELGGSEVRKEEMMKVMGIEEEGGGEEWLGDWEWDLELEIEVGVGREKWGVGGMVEKMWREGSDKG